MTSKFTVIDRSWAPSWLHENNTSWVNFYDTVLGRPAIYQAYRAVEPVPEGRMPWTVDNRRIGTLHGYKTLEEAMEAIK